MRPDRAFRRLARWTCFALVSLAASGGPGPGRAADPQPYDVVIASTGEAPLDQAVHDSSTLISLRADAPVGPFALVARARTDRDRFITALHSFGYYAGQVAITIDGLPLDDPTLPAHLDALPAKQTARVEVKLTPGPVFHLRRITVQGDVPAAAKASLGLKEGDPAIAANVLAARNRLLAALRDSGHAFAKVDEPVATLIAPSQALDVNFTVDAGPRVDLGAIRFEGLERMNESFVRRRLLLHSGEPYNPDAIEKARQDLVSVGVFSSVRITTADRLDPQGNLPVTVDVSERKLRTVSFGAAFSTDQGGSVSVNWTHRNLFGNAERLTLGASVAQLGGTASQQPGYSLSATLTLPDWRRRDEDVTFNVTALREFLDAYDRTAIFGSAVISRRLTPDITISAGIAPEQANIKQEGVARDYTLMQLPLGLQYDTAHDLLDPTHGVRAALNLTPTQSFSNTNATFLIAQASGAGYLDLGTQLGLSGGVPGRSIFATRALVGVIAGASTFDIPPDQRFYAGGGGTVRGYRFQSIGPQFPDGKPVGGTGINVGSVEFRQRIGESYGAAAFVDAGQVGSNGVPFQGKVAVGAGMGARYYTAIGPIRLDVAFPLVAIRGGDAVEVYIGLGQAF
jgi:translocation and assembly module TamA